MTPPLFLVDELPPGDEVHLRGDEGRHAARVKRLTRGEAVLISDGRGELLECTVTVVASDGLQLAVQRRRSVPIPDPRLVVVQALPKGERAELAVEMLTELGVDEIVPWAASRSIVQWHGTRGDKALEKWRRTAREAAKQSRRARVPEVGALLSTREVADRLSRGCGLVLHEAATRPLATVDLSDAGEVIVVIGPEGGIASNELAEFAAAGARSVRLGDPVLRTSTAGAAALAVLSVRLGRWA
jgi:16S rRNA (uracil1498-N3)-methyltransferase